MPRNDEDPGFRDRTTRRLDGIDRTTRRLDEIGPAVVGARRIVDGLRDSAVDVVVVKRLRPEPLLVVDRDVRVVRRVVLLRRFLRHARTLRNRNRTLRRHLVPRLRRHDHRRRRVPRTVP